MTIQGAPAEARRSGSGSLSYGRDSVLEHTWYVGIVYYNSDYSFTVTNVVSHGVPYFGLIWIYCRRKWGLQQRNSWLHSISQPKWIGAFMGILIFLAFLEEWIWDVFVWKQHIAVFGVSNRFVSLAASAGLSLLVPLL